MSSLSSMSPAEAFESDPRQVRRRVDAAQRRALRRAVALAAALAAVLLVVDLCVNYLMGTRGISTLAPFTGAAVALSASLPVLAHRGTVRAEALGLIGVLNVFGVTLLGEALTPDQHVLSTAQLAIILSGVGLFLPWHQPWHVATLVLSIALAVAFLLSPLGAPLSGNDAGNLIAAVLMATVTSLIGHRLSQGRMRAMLEQQFTLRRLSRYAHRQESNVTELNRELSLVARRDPLTGVGNRLAFDEAIARLLARREGTHPSPFALVLFDLDHFKAYNDEHGHQAGDAALLRTGEILLGATRDSDVAFRYGGEEFVLLVPGGDLTVGLAVAERVRVATEQTVGLPPFTVSGGVALCDPADGPDPQPLVRRADTALYIAKRAGRSRIVADALSIALQRKAIAVA